MRIVKNVKRAVPIELVACPEKKLLVSLDFTILIISLISGSLQGLNLRNVSLNKLAVWSQISIKTLINKM